MVASSTLRACGLLTGPQASQGVSQPFAHRPAASGLVTEPAESADQSSEEAGHSPVPQAVQNQPCAQSQATHLYF